ncbi:MAG: hypothetical protein V1819_03160 [bacterium]
MKKIKLWVLGGSIVIITLAVGVLLDWILICRHQTGFCGIIPLYIGCPWPAFCGFIFYKLGEPTLLIYLLPVFSVAIYFAIGALIGLGISKISKRIKN